MSEATDAFYDNVNKYTKYKVVEMLMKKHLNRFEDLDTVEEVADDVLRILSICGLKFYGDLKRGKSAN